jgi:hypothetical protein
MDVYRQHQRFEREQRFREQMRRNREAWQASSGIEDLGAPPGYRYLFDLPPKRPIRSTFVSDVT